jgi:chemotaxis protein MotB
MDTHTFKEDHMRSVTTFSAAALLVSVSMFGTGCVQQDKYDQLVMANRSLQEQNISLEADRDEARANLDTVRGQLGQATAELNGLKSKYGLAQEDIDKMGRDYAELMKRVGTLDFGPLPEEMSKALNDLAAQYPDMLTFDSKRGMLRFASDFTFASGSTELNSSAVASLGKLAQILNAGSASGFEVHVVGHTDSVPVSKPETKRMFPDNMYLSAGRAISVHHALLKDGVSGGRMMVAGWGEYRPSVSNNPGKAGTAPNRRVEIYLTPMHDVTPSTGSAVAESSSKKTTTPAKPKTTDMVNGEPMK